MFKKIYVLTDFSVLAPENKCEEQIRQMDVISSLLVAASDEEKTEVLQHPIIGIKSITSSSFTTQSNLIFLSVLFVCYTRVYRTFPGPKMVQDMSFLLPLAGNLFHFCHLDEHLHYLTYSSH